MLIVGQGNSLLLCFCYYYLLEVIRVLLILRVYKMHSLLWCVILYELYQDMIYSCTQNV